MKAQYDNTPSLIKKLQGGIIINFNAVKKTIPSPTGDRDTYECDQVKVSDNPDKGEIVSAIIRSKYSTSDELALIHNGTDSEKHAGELAKFNVFRAAAKSIADAVMEQV